MFVSHSAVIIMSSESSAGLPRIFVSIIAYRDPELVPTLVSLLGRAAHPERIVAGVVWQGDDTDELDCGVLKKLDALVASLPAGGPTIRQVRLSHLDARGPCYARALAQERLFGHEDFFLQIDSHMRFSQAWDRSLIQQWTLCATDKAIITTYPPPYARGEEEENDHQQEKQKEQGGPSKTKAATNDSSATAAAASAEESTTAADEAEDPPTVLCASHFHATDGMLRIVGRRLVRSPSGPLESSLYAAGFAFGSGVVASLVPYDPHLKNLFFGEESAMAARLYTSGFRFFTPTANIVFHCWTRDYRPSFREVTAGDPKQQRRENIAKRRVMNLLNMKPLESAPATVDEALDDASDPTLSSTLCVPEAPYGLGSVRTLSEFFAQSGVDFSSRTVSERGRNGGLDPRLFQTPLVDATQAAQKQAQINQVMQLVRMQQMEASTPAPSKP